jgi:ubiquinone/menaquinone biosynthesis C-methylase UbiE
MNNKAGTAGAREPDDSKSQGWLSDTEAIRHLHLKPGMTVADVHPADGYLTIPIAREVGPRGKVFAIESRAERLAALQARLKSHSHVEAVHGTPIQTTLPPDCCDIVLMADIWNDLGDHKAALREASRILRDTGRLIIVDWRTDAPCPPGPDTERRVEFRELFCAVENHGWTVHSFGDAGRHRYFLELTPTDESVQS